MNDDGPVLYYAYDRRTKAAKFLFESRPDLKNYQLAPMEPFSFKSRDGLTVLAAFEAWLRRAAGLAARRTDHVESQEAYLEAS